MVGGVCYDLPWIPEGVYLASVRLFLEARATAQSGKTIELEDIESLLRQALKNTSQSRSQDDKR